MQNRVERHIFVGRKDIEDVCHKSGLLYNAANYIMRQSFFETGRAPSAYDIINKFTEEHQPDYYALPSQTAQQTIILLGKNWKSFFKARREYGKNPRKFVGRPKPPGYKIGRKQNIVIRTDQQSKIRDGKVSFPKGILESLKTKVAKSQFLQIRIIPQATCHVIEVVYEVEETSEDVSSENILAIDLGVNNFAMCISNIGLQPFIVNGGPVKSMNQFFNKRKAQFQSYLNGSPYATSNRITSLFRKRNCKMEDFLHKSANHVVAYCIEHHIGRIIIGKNDGWKQNINHGKRNNQNFVQIPFAKWIQKVKYKAEAVGIKVETVEESYTSKVDHLAFEEMCHHEKYMGRRIGRGMFKSSTGAFINADVNGAIGIGIKAVGKDFLLSLLDRGVVLTPVRIAIS